MDSTTTVSFQIFRYLLSVNPTIPTMTLYTYLEGSRDSSVDIAIRYGLDGPKIESR
jgi:hypothetical protein